MQGPITTWWGKLDRDPATAAVRAWHPLLHHCADVAAVAHSLLSLPTWNHRLAELCGWKELTPAHASRLSVLAAFHDLGKFNQGFQRKAVANATNVAGHVREMVAVLNANDLTRFLVDALAWPQFEAWGVGDASVRLWLAAVGHHGHPVKVDGARLESSRIWTDTQPRNPWDGMRLLATHARAWFPQAWEPAAAFPESPQLEHAFAGLVMLADWLGSDRRFFEYSESWDAAQPAQRMKPSLAAAQLALRSVGLEVTAAAAAVRGKAPFALLSPHPKARAAQEVLFSQPLPTRASITVLEAETGSGKTEAAIGRFIQMLGAGLVDGMYFALPTRTAATQMHARVMAAVTRAFPENVRPPLVLAVPGYLRVDNVNGTHLPDFKVQWPDNPADVTRYRRWAVENSKRYMVGTVVVGTVDQALLSALMVGHAHLRSTALLRHLLVVDEVHASDTYMTRVLREVLDHQFRAGGHALLLSATLGANTRSKLVEKPGDGARTLSLPSYQSACQSPYPLITQRDGDTITTAAVPSDQAGKTVGVEVLPLLEDNLAVALRAMHAAEQGAAVLVVRNSVAQAIATQQAVEALGRTRDAGGVLFRVDGIPMPHHSRFARRDRELMDRALEFQFGANRAPGGRVVVATQTVQQSLDLDADLLITDLCPMDVLLQRIGRLHRHQRPRPAGFESARACVVVPQERDLGTLITEKGNVRYRNGLGGEVYGDIAVLEATWTEIERRGTFNIPADNRALVEASVHPEALAAICKAKGALWELANARVFGHNAAQNQVADINLVPWSENYSNVTFPNDRAIRSRLGEMDRLVNFEKPAPGPLGKVESLTVKAYWARDAGETEEMAQDVMPMDGGFAFTFGSKRFLYDRLGLRPWVETEGTHDQDPEP